MNEKKKQKKITKVMIENQAPKPIRNYKDRVFRMIFKDKSKLLELYNAVNNTEYQNPEELTITTLENALYLGMKNDVSFVLHDQLSLYEHQSTDNPNMPLRNLFYISDVYSGLIIKDDLHSLGRVQIPEPKFLVFYNGTKEMPERWEQKLSDAYLQETTAPALELKTTVLNINLGRNQELADKCRPLQEYMIFVEKIRTYHKHNRFEQAVELAVSDCIQEGVMSDFLIKNRAEVVRMSIYEYNAEKVQQADREYGRQLGLKEGLAMAIYRKMEKGKTISTMAEELEVDITVVERIVKVEEMFVGKYDWSEVRNKIIEIL